jgi:hypothetical protein
VGNGHVGRLKGAKLPHRRFRGLPTASNTEIPKDPTVMVVISITATRHRFSASLSILLNGRYLIYKEQLYESLGLC